MHFQIDIFGISTKSILLEYIKQVSNNKKRMEFVIDSVKKNTSCNIQG